MSTPTDRPSQSEILALAQRFIENAETRHGVCDSATLRNYYYVVTKVILDTLKMQGIVIYQRYSDDQLFSAVVFDLQTGAGNPFSLIDLYAGSSEEKWSLVGRLFEWASKKFVATFHSEFADLQFRQRVKAHATGLTR